VALLSAATAQAQTYSQLSPLPGNMEGAPILVSNNPESVNRAGLLLGMDAMNSTDPGRVTRRLTGATTLDSGCPSGGMREFSFYMHHILGDPIGTDPRVDRIFLILEPVGSSATYTAYGAAISQRDILEQAAYTLDPGRSPSYSVARVLVTGAMPSWVGSTNGSQIISHPTTAPRTITGPTQVFQLRRQHAEGRVAGRAHHLPRQQRLPARASGGCAEHDHHRDRGQRSGQVAVRLGQRADHLQR
jgi:hypothetical protein